MSFPCCLMKVFALLWNNGHCTCPAYAKTFLDDHCFCIAGYPENRPGAALLLKTNFGAEIKAPELKTELSPGCLEDDIGSEEESVAYVGALRDSIRPKYDIRLNCPFRPEDDMER